MTNWHCFCGNFVREKRFCRRCGLVRFSLERQVILDYFHLNVGTVTGGLPFNLPLNRLGQHVLVSGQTGTGKSRFAMNLTVKAENYPQYQKIKLLVVDVEGEWKGIIPQLKEKPFYYDVAKNLKINPFDLKDSALIKELLRETVFKGIEKEYSDLSAQMNFVLNNAVEKSNNLAELIKNIRNYNDQKLSALDRTKTALMVRLDPFLHSPLREIFLCKKSSIDFDHIDEKNVIIDLHSLDAKVAYNLELRLIYNTITSYYLRKMLYRGTRSSVSNLFVADEAHLLVPKILHKLIVTESWPATEFATRLRKRGCGMVLITQSPSNIEKDIFKNMGTKVCFRMQHAEDIKLISESCGFVDQVEYQFLSDKFVRLPSKQAILCTANHEPFLITSENFKPSDDEPLVILEDDDDDLFPLLSEVQENPDEKIFLNGIETFPFMPVRERRKWLGWNDRRYSNTVNSLIRQKKIETATIKLGSGAPKIFYQKVGAVPSIRHEYFVHWISDRIIKNGLAVKTNVKKGPDIVIPKLNTAIEVELGKSNVHGNMERNTKQYDKVIVCSDEKKLLEFLSRENKLPNVLFLPIQKVPDAIE